VRAVQPLPQGFYRLSFPKKEHVRLLRIVGHSNYVSAIFRLEIKVCGFGERNKETDVIVEPQACEKSVGQVRSFQPKCCHGQVNRFQLSVCTKRYVTESPCLNAVFGLGENIDTYLKLILAVLVRSI